MSLERDRSKKYSENKFLKRSEIRDRLEVPSAAFEKSKNPVMNARRMSVEERKVLQSLDKLNNFLLSEGRSPSSRTKRIGKDKK